MAKVKDDGKSGSAIQSEASPEKAEVVVKTDTTETDEVDSALLQEGEEGEESLEAKEITETTEEDDAKSKFIPRDRFDEVYHEREDLKKQLEEERTKKRAETFSGNQEVAPELTPEEKQARDYLSKMGYVHKDDLKKMFEPIQKERVQTDLERFYDKHPEMHPDADEGNQRWEKVEKFFKLFNSGTNSERLEWSYKLAFGNKTSDQVAQEAENKTLIAAKRAEQASLGGGGGSALQKESPKLTPEEAKNAKKMGISPEEWVKYR